MESFQDVLLVLISRLLMISLAESAVTLVGLIPCGVPAPYKSRFWQGGLMVDVPAARLVWDSYAVVIGWYLVH